MSFYCSILIKLFKEFKFESSGANNTFAFLAKGTKSAVTHNL